MPVRVGILLSGRGSNFLALHQTIDHGEIPAQIALVVSNQPGARGAAKAQELGLPVRVLPHADEPNRQAHEAKVVAALEEAEVEWVCLAGYMRKLSPFMVGQFPSRILNIHPSLLPAFPGLHAQEQAVRHGVKVSGCTVHLVDDGLDSGPIVLQRTVEVRDDDTGDSLSHRILEQEHRAYPEALRKLLTEPWSVEGRRVVFSGRSKSAAAR